MIFTYKISRNLLILFLILISFYSISISQELRIYNVSCDPGEFQFLMENPDQNDYIDCSFEYEGENYDDARIRLRGESSLYYPKKSFKINFDGDNRFNDAGRIRDKINLVSEYSDPSFAREYLAYDLFHLAGLYASSTWYVRLYVNDIYYGLYLDVEQVDRHYLGFVDLPDDASVFKADQPACYLNPDDDFELDWDKKENVDTGYDELVELIDWLDTTDSFYEELPEYFNRTELARIIAVNSLIANGSTYYHNYYLVHDIDPGGIWHMMPWDMDGTYVYWNNYIMWRYYRCGHQSHDKNNTLISKCWTDPQMRELIVEQIGGIGDSLFTEEYYDEITFELESLLEDAVDEDTLKQYSLEDFFDRLSQFGTIVEGRKAKINEQLETWPLPFDLHQPGVENSSVTLTWDESDIADGSTVNYEILYDSDFIALDTTSNVINDIQENSYQFTNLFNSLWYFRVNALNEDGDRTQCLRNHVVAQVEGDTTSGTWVINPVQESTTWTVDGSPYLLPLGLNIYPDADLTINPGVTVLVGAGRSIDVGGDLFASGTRQDSIYFDRLDENTPWGVISASGDDRVLAFEFCNFSGAGDSLNGVAPGAMIQVEDGTLMMFDCNLSHGAAGAVRVRSGDAHIDRTTMSWFSNNPDYLELYGVHPDVVRIGGGRLVFRANTIKNGPLEGAHIDLLDLAGTSQSEITGNWFYGCGDDGIDLDNVLYARVSRNYVEGCADKGINIGSGSHHIYVDNNIVLECGEALGVKDSCRVDVWNNYFADSEMGVALENSADGGLVFLRNNIIWNNNEDISDDPQSVLDAEYNCISSEVVFQGEGNINEDPRLADPDGGDYTPMAGSPLIDAGFGSLDRVIENEGDTLAPIETLHPPTDMDYFIRVDFDSIPNSGGGDVDYVDIGLVEYYSDVQDSNVKDIPSSFLFAGNHPNPFNDGTVIDFYLAYGSEVQMDIYNIMGQKVYSRRLEGLRGNMVHSIYWYSKDNNGMHLATGIYICKIEQDIGTKYFKMLKMK